MPRTTIEPLHDLESVIPVDLTVDTEATLERIQAGFLELLLGHHCACNGSARGRERDPSWVRDIGQLVGRIMPHPIVHQDMASGIWVTETRSLKLPSLRCEVDDNDEICVWIYEES